MLNEKYIAEYRGTSLLHTDKDIFVQPHKALRPYIAGYMLSKPISMPDRQSIMPTASTTLVYTVDAGGVAGGVRGVNTRPVEIARFARQFPLLLLVEFHPGGFYPFLKIEQRELADQAFSGQELDRELDIRICEAAEQAENIDGLVRMIDQIFLNRMDRYAINPAFLEAMHKVIGSRGMIQSSQLAAEIHYSEKQLNRMFHRYVGTGSKMFSRIVHVNYAMGILDRAGSTVDEAAERTGYYDASHLVRELKDLCGITPREYQQNMSVFYNDPFKL